MPDVSGGASPPPPAAGRPHAANWLLRALPLDEFARLAPHLEPVPLEAGRELAAPDEPVRSVYFPTTAVLSLVNRTAGGGAVEVGTVGREGMAGLAAFLAAEESPNALVVQVPGTAVCLPAALLGPAADERPALRRVLHRYTLAFLTQVAQTASCNRAHGVEARCARWLLLTHDRVGADTFELTQEFLALMLGVRRAGVGAAAGALQRAGAIRYVRGRITVRDRAALEGAACECYGIVRATFDRLVGAPHG